MGGQDPFPRGRANFIGTLDTEIRNRIDDCRPVRICEAAKPPCEAPSGEKNFAAGSCTFRCPLRPAETRSPPKNSCVTRYRFNCVVFPVAQIRESFKSFLSI